MKTLSQIRADLTSKISKSKKGYKRLAYYFSKFPLAKKYYKLNPFIRVLYNVIFGTDSDMSIAIVGGKGKGKSITALIIGIMLMWDKFRMSRIIYSKEQFRDLVTKSRRGEVIILDETGTQKGVSSLDWFSPESKDVVDLVQVCRTKHLVIIFNSPRSKFINNRIRDMFNCTIEMIHADAKKGYSIGKPMMTHVLGNSKSNDIFEYLIRFYVKGKKYVLEKIKFPKPPDTLIDLYYKRRKEFTDSLYKEMKKGKESKSKSKKKEQVDRTDKLVKFIIDKVKNNELKFSSLIYNKNFSQLRIMTFLSNYFKDISNLESRKVAVKLNWLADKGEIDIQKT